MSCSIILIRDQFSLVNQPVFHSESFLHLEKYKKRKQVAVCVIGFLVEVEKGRDLKKQGPKKIKGEKRLPTLSHHAEVMLLSFIIII